MIDSSGRIFSSRPTRKPPEPEPIVYESGQLDLIFPITFEGRTFIPLVELGKIHFAEMYDDLEFKVEPSTNGGFVHVTHKNKLGWDFAFSNHTSQGSFRLQMNGKDVLVNQLEMFAYLHKWGFDIFKILSEDLRIK